MAYSIKTNPDDRLLSMALDASLLAEAISRSEVEKATSIGFAPERVVLNGPAKWWPPGPQTGQVLHAIFCDSLEEFRQIARTAQDQGPPAEVLGIRLRIPGTGSRFGVPVDQYDTFRELAAAIEGLLTACKLGVHFHFASSVAGIERWWQLFEAVITWAAALERLGKRSIEVLDLGGGWFPSDFDIGFRTRLAAAVPFARSALRDLRELIVEPGKALAQPAMALGMRVLEIRSQGRRIHEIVVDGSIAELSQAGDYPHRILRYNTRTRKWESLGRGGARILGRLCIEEDILATDVHVPAGTRVGDFLVVCDAGGYDRSMAYAFGKGHAAS